MSLSVASADGVFAAAASGRSILVWGAHAAPVEYCPTYIQNTSNGDVAIRQSQSVQIDNPNSIVVGVREFVVSVDCSPSYYTGVTIKGGSTPSFRSIWYAMASGFYRDQNRFGVGFRPSTEVVFGDRYLGDPNPLYYWRPDRDYSLGDIVIPSSTTLDNPEGNRMFVCVVAGRSSSSEPEWNATFTSHPRHNHQPTADGSVVWQNNHPDLEGKWQPFDTSVINQGYSIHTAAKVTSNGSRANLEATPVLPPVLFSSPGAYGFAINGVNGTPVTRPFPIDGTIDGDLHNSPASIRFGRLKNPRVPIQSQLQI